jgi:hypothetical protein
MQINPIGPIIVGLVIGLLSGFFGVGGGFLLTPTLNIILGIPYNIAVGSGLSQMIGTAASGLRRHHKLGNISYKLGLTMLGGNILGVLIGTRLLNGLKSMAQVRIGSLTLNALDLTLNALFALLLLAIGVMMGLEARRALREEKEAEPRMRFKGFPPRISVGTAGEIEISIPMVLIAGFIIGVMTGLLGIGGGVVIMPIFVYLLGVPTRMAVGTSLFLVLCSALIGTTGHALSGNVSLSLVIYTMVGSTAGAQVGALLTEKVRAQRIRGYFSMVTLAAAGMVIFKLVRMFLRS